MMMPLCLSMMLVIPCLATAEELDGKILFFTKSAGYEHEVVRRHGESLSFAERTLIKLGEMNKVEVLVTKNGSIFDTDLSDYDAFCFYTSGVLTLRGTDDTEPMTEVGKKRLLEAIGSQGKGFIGIHSTADTFRTDNSPNQPNAQVDPFIAMLGGEFLSHGRQQAGVMRVADPSFPGLDVADSGFALFEEWYALDRFSRDLHVLLTLETRGMRGASYDRRAMPSTWIRQHGNGRVFYTSMGHRADVWTNPLFQRILIGGIQWARGAIDFPIVPSSQNSEAGNVEVTGSRDVNPSQ